MRTGPFSDSRVIDRLNAYFVPVLAVNEDYKGGGPAPKEERDEYRRIYRESLAAKFSGNGIRLEHTEAITPAWLRVSHLPGVQFSRPQASSGGMARVTTWRILHVRNHLHGEEHWR